MQDIVRTSISHYSSITLNALTFFSTFDTILYEELLSKSSQLELYAVGGVATNDLITKVALYGFQNLRLIPIKLGI